MEVGDALYGVTMRGDGVSAVISQRLRDAERLTAIDAAAAPAAEAAPARPTRADYVAWRPPRPAGATTTPTATSTTPRYYELFDTAVNAHLYDATGVDVRALPQIGVVAETGCRYFREIGFPEPDRDGARRGPGRHLSSIVYRIGLFQGDVRRGRGRGPLRARVRRQLPRRRRPAGDPDPGRRAGGRRTPPAAGGVSLVTATRRWPTEMRGSALRGVSMLGATLSDHLGRNPVLAIILMMTFGVLVAGAVAVYVAYPAPRRGDARRAAARRRDAQGRRLPADARGLRVPRLNPPPTGPRGR